MKRSAFLIAAVLPLAACEPDPESTPDLRAPPVEVAGDPVDCVLTSRIQTTVVRDDYTIDFEMLGDEVYRNTLDRRCPGLGFEKAFGYEVSTGQLCSVDMISVIRSGEVGRGARCSLGEFVPVRYAAGAR